jgi:ElaB/YqjD/DUF883 family membrane-anchored ribosome-binding protein
MTDATPKATPKPTRKSTKLEKIETVAADATATAQTTVDKVREQAATMASEATDAARKAANQGKDKAADALDGLSKFADDAAKTVDAHLGPQYGDYARMASTSVSNAASALHTKDVDTLVADAGAFVRKRPAVVIGTLAAVGLIVAGILMPRRSNNSDKA